MRYLILSDIHANLEALEAVLGDAGDYDAVLCLGDLVGYGPNPNEVVERVRALPDLTCLAGNHDWAALGKLDLNAFNAWARQAAEWTSREMKADVRTYLDGLSPRLVFGHFDLAHASPRDPIWEYLETAEQGPPNFACFETQFCLVGHTHVPRILLERSNGADSEVQMPRAHEVVDLGNGRRQILNPGGVGQPRNGDPRAAYGVLDTERGSFTFRRVPYPVQETQRKIIAAGLPPALAARLELGL